MPRIPFQDTYYSSGEWNVICDVCGRKMKSSDAYHRWDGAIVCRKDYETRHKLDLLKEPNTLLTVPNPSPIADTNLYGDWIITEGPSTDGLDYNYIHSEDNQPIAMES